MVDYSSLLYGQHVWLDVPREVDASLLWDWWQDADSLRMMKFDAARPLSVDSLRNWLHKATSEQHAFLIRTVAENRLVGIITLAWVDARNQCLQFGLVVDPATRGRGYGGEGVQLLLNYAFLEMNMNRVELEALAINPANRLYERLGFRHEGTRREYVFRDGQYQDVIVMSILRSEWDAAREPRDV